MKPARALLVLALALPVALAAALPPAPSPAGQEAQTRASRFAGRTVVITGANRGLGLEFARQYAAAGAKVVGTARDPETATELAATGARVLPLDVTDGASVAALAKALGGTEIALLVNNAGINGGVSTEEGVDYDRIARILEVNTIGPMRVTHALTPHLAAAGDARVVNVSSIMGSIERSSGGGLGYRESKAALNMFTRSYAMEHRADGMVCIAVHPGWVRTDMGGERAPLEPAESIRGLRAVIEGLTAEHTGRFFQHDGEELPW